YLIRLRVDINRLNPDFLSYVINSPIGRQQINALSRQIIGQANINSKELRCIRIPCPPLNIQERIMRKTAEGLDEVARECEAVELQVNNINAEIEALITGTKSIEEAR